MDFSRRSRENIAHTKRQNNRRHCKLLRIETEFNCVSAYWMQSAYTQASVWCGASRQNAFDGCDQMVFFVLFTDS